MKVNTKQLSSKKYLGYVRVSSRDQSRGTSLEEQKKYIENYAIQKGFVLARFYGEVESASKIGRERFDDMITELRNGDYVGIIFHKTDRSARNPKDQALMYDLMQEGYELHFVAEGISTTEPVGRNMMYMLWGMASGYSENLRAEINKGIQGRLNQGRVPWHLPIGYTRVMDGSCRAIPDVKTAPLVKQLFKEYASGIHSMRTLTQRAKEIGLRNRGGNLLGKSCIEGMLHQTFYYGMISHKRGTYKGEHEPIITKSTFDKVQYFRKKRGFKRKYSHAYVFGNLIGCPACGTMLKSTTATKNHKWKYYWCRNKLCPFVSFRESDLEGQAIEQLKKIELSDEELKVFTQVVREYGVRSEGEKLKQVQAIELQLKNIQARLDSLIGLLADEKIDVETHQKMRIVLINKQLELFESKQNIEQNEERRLEEIQGLGKLLKSPSIAFKYADTVHRRNLITSIVENCHTTPNGLVFIWKKPFDVIAKRPIPKSGGGGEHRTPVQRKMSCMVYVA